MEVGTIIDLTKSRNYYNFQQEMENLDCPDINYVKIACRGRGQSPLPSEVNEAVWQIFCHHEQEETKEKYILLHCTHGFNRTGYIVVAALMRLRLGSGLSMKRAIARFAMARPPGIYKDQYINDLFKYYHELRDSTTVTPPVPAWKGNNDAEDAADAANEDEAGAGEEGAAGELPAVVTSHEDIWAIGERVSDDEAEWVRHQVCMLLRSVVVNSGKLRFPGMQPVSLSIDRLGDLAAFRYHVTWKADGTRYMMFIAPLGTYLMDRSFNVVRCQMRFMNGVRGRLAPGEKHNYPVRKPLTLTVLDGEMVLDVDPTGTQPPRLRYLIYDLCMINNEPLIEKPWKERYRAIDSHIVLPRNAERAYIDKWRGRTFDHERADYLSPPLGYVYTEERFSVRRKDFWPTWQIDKVFQRFTNTHSIGHESDGIILQGVEDPYIAGTCERLYKWKFAHMNSVDFLLRCESRIGASGQPELDLDNPEPLKLFLLDQNARGRGIKYVELSKVDKDGHYQVEFPPEVDPITYDGKLVECTLDCNRGVWMFMRERKDKDTPNASRVYLRIKESIINHVDQQLLVGTLKDALLNQPAYVGDRANLNPEQQEKLRREVAAWRQEMEEQQRTMAATRRPSGPHDDFDDEEPFSPPPASPPPPGYFDEDYQEDFAGAHVGSDTDGGGLEGYKVSDVDMDTHAATHKRPQDPGDDGQEERRPKRRVTRWPFDVDAPYPHCPVYEGYGFD
ncbi:hypothetical protein Vretimale_12219 [Volvox reticuliferus]|nr:hypothetical protein Vretimale_12219 [Volvox reticuliferus]